MPELLRVNASNRDFEQLVSALDRYLAMVDGSEHPFYDQFNQIEDIPYAVVCYENEIAVACGAIKPFDSGAMEIKRMFTQPGFRGKGYAGQVLHELENWTKELGYNGCVLETGKKQKKAIQLYLKSGYIQIPNYGPYQGVENSLCFEKKF